MAFGHLCQQMGGRRVKLLISWSPQSATAALSNSGSHGHRRRLDAVGNNRYRMVTFGWPKPEQGQPLARRCGQGPGAGIVTIRAAMSQGEQRLILGGTAEWGRPAGAVGRAVPGHPLFPHSSVETGQVAVDRQSARCECAQGIRQHCGQRSAHSVARPVLILAKTWPRKRSSGSATLEDR